MGWKMVVAAGAALATGAALLAARKKKEQAEKIKAQMKKTSRNKHGDTVYDEVILKKHKDGFETEIISEKITKAKKEMFADKKILEADESTAADFPSEPVPDLVLPQDKSPYKDESLQEPENETPNVYGEVVTEVSPDAESLKLNPDLSPAGEYTNSADGDVVVVSDLDTETAGEDTETAEDNSSSYSHGISSAEHMEDNENNEYSGDEYHHDESHEESYDEPESQTANPITREMIASLSKTLTELQQGIKDEQYIEGDKTDLEGENSANNHEKKFLSQDNQIQNADDTIFKDLNANPDTGEKAKDGNGTYIVNGALNTMDTIDKTDSELKNNFYNGDELAGNKPAESLAYTTTDDSVEKTQGEPAQVNNPSLWEQIPLPLIEEDEIDPDVAKLFTNLGEKEGYEANTSVDDLMKIIDDGMHDIKVNHTPPPSLDSVEREIVPRNDVFDVFNSMVSDTNDDLDKHKDEKIQQEAEKNQVGLDILRNIESFGNLLEPLYMVMENKIIAKANIIFDWELCIKGLHNIDGLLNYWQNNFNNYEIWSDNEYVKKAGDLINIIQLSGIKRDNRKEFIFSRKELIFYTTQNQNELYSLKDGDTAIVDKPCWSSAERVIAKGIIRKKYRQ